MAHRRITARLAVAALTLLAVVAIAGPARAEQAGSEQRKLQAGLLDAGLEHNCGVLGDGSVRCWGLGAGGRLGYGNTSSIGDGETPGSVGPVDLGVGRTARAIAAGGDHSCALLDDDTVRCWGRGSEGRLGYAAVDDVGDNEAPGSVGPVELGAGRTARAISAGTGHSCAVLDDGNVRCWGSSGLGQLGYGDTGTVGDDEAPGSVAPVDLGAGRTALAVSAGRGFTCAVLDDGSVRCWGWSSDGQLGYGNLTTIGDNETPGSVGPVNLGAGRTARAIATGFDHTCALLDDGTVRCWGSGFGGRLGYGNINNVGDNESPGLVGPVNLGGGRTARAIAAGAGHTCALLDNGTVRCWGSGADGRLGYGNTSTIGDNETPGSVGPVDLGAGRTARAITAGGSHTCALLDNGTVRCWGSGSDGRLGYGNASSIGDGETPGSVAPLDLAGVLPDAAGDLSLDVSADATQLGVGAATTLTVTVRNAGPDAVTGVGVSAPLPGGLALSSATASQGRYDGATGIWQVGRLGAGGQATLTLVATAQAAGSPRMTAEVAFAGTPDADSIPANGAAEDDRGSVQLEVAALPAPAGPPAPAPPPPVPPPAARDTTPPSLSVTVPRRAKLRALRRGVKVGAAPNEAARLTFELLARPRRIRLAAAGDLVLAQRSLALATGRRVVRLRAARRLLGKPARGFRAKVRVVAVDAAGNRRTVTRAIRIGR